MKVYISKQLWSLAQPLASSMRCSVQQLLVRALGEKLLREGGRDAWMLGDGGDVPVFDWEAEKVRLKADYARFYAAKADAAVAGSDAKES